jgi:hypothetical protein
VGSVTLRPNYMREKSLPFLPDMVPSGRRGEELYVEGINCRMRNIGWLYIHVTGRYLNLDIWQQIGVVVSCSVV